MSRETDVNLLFGVLALQMDLVTRDQLIDAMHGWILRKNESLGTILRQRGALGADEHSLLEALVAKHLEKHHGDPQRSLAAVGGMELVRDELKQFDDPELIASLAGGQETSVPADPSATLPVERPSPGDGSRYRILRPHARGGLGEVFVARDEELRREVALKQIQPQHAQNAVHRERFVREAEVTGGLEHPGIVPIYGLGQYGDGRPFYAMRLIRGHSLKDAIQRFHQPVSARAGRQERAIEMRRLLRRFIDVCEAINYAHSRGVLHRDLKPGNIMLGKYGETLVVDWGLAKVKGTDELRQGARASEPPLDLKLDSGSEPTAMGSTVGTPSYMSPEQAQGRLDLLGVPSDVYSLGATLFHLLTGHPPVEGSSVGEVLEQVREGRLRRARQLNAEVPRPLEAICLKAMAHEATDRYSSAAALAEDVERWLADEPVSAHRDRVVDRASRWFRKHRGIAMSAAAAVTLVAVVSLVAAIIINGQRLHIQTKEQEARHLAEQFFHISQAEKRERAQAEVARQAEQLAREEAVRLSQTNAELADRERALREKAEELAQKNEALATAERREVEKARLLTRFLVGTFEVSDPLGLGGLPFFIPKSTGEELTARQILDRGFQRVEEELRDEPEVQAAVKGTIGNVYRSLGHLREAEQLLQSALDQHRKLLPPDHLDLAQSCHDLAWLYHERGDFARAEPLYLEALQIRRAHEPESALLTAATMLNLGWMCGQSERFDEAERWLGQTLEIRRKLLGSDHRDTAVVQLGMAFCQVERGRWLQAVPYLASAQAVLRQFERDPTVGQAAVKFLEGLIADPTLGPQVAERLLRESQLLLEKSLGQDHIYGGVILFERARRLEELGQDADAEACYRGALDIARRKVQLQHPRINLLISEFGYFLVRKGQRDEALALWDDFLAAQERGFGRNSLYYADALTSHGVMLEQLGDKDRARQQWDAALAIYPQEPPPSRLMHLQALVSRGLLMTDDPSTAVEAETIFRTVFPSVRTRFGPRARATAEVQTNIGRALLAQDKLEEAEQQLKEALSIVRLLWGKERQPALDYVYEWQSVLYRRMRRPDDAVKAIENRAALWPDNPRALYLAAAELAGCLAAGPDGSGQALVTAAEERERVRRLALETLKQALDRGFRAADRLRTDQRWTALREDAEFQALLARLTPGGPPVP